MGIDLGTLKKEIKRAIRQNKKRQRKKIKNE